MPPIAACSCPSGFKTPSCRSTFAPCTPSISTTGAAPCRRHRSAALCKALEAKLGATEDARPRRQRQRKSAPQVSICVLPFANMSGDPEQEYFSDGITEDVITDLGKVSALSIVSRNMAFSFKGAKGGVGEIGRQTKAAYVLVGSVRKAGARVRITAQLVNAAPRRRSGASVTTATSTTSSRCRTRSRRRSSRRSS